MKKVLYVIIGIIVLYLILALIGPSNMKVEKTVAINKPAALVKKQVADYYFFHDKWSPWTDLDPNMKTSYAGNAGEVGHKYEWSGNSDVRSGAMEIMGFSGDSIIQKLSFGENGSEGVTTSYYIVTDNNGTANVSWGMGMKMPFLFRPILLFTDMDINAQFEKGLNKLKTAIEEMKDEPAATDYAVTEQAWEEKNYLGKKQTINIENNNLKAMSDFMMETYPKLFADLEKNKIQPVGPASAIFYTWDDKKTDMAVLAPVDKNANAKDWEKITVPAGKALMVVHTGPDEASMGAHTALMDHMKANNLQHQYVVEEYINHHTEKDSTKWITNIYYILK